VRVDQPFQTVMDGFTPELLDAFTTATGLRWMGNEAASGTEIIARLGDRHRATGAVIVYTSSDSVLQVAAHREVLSAEALHVACARAFEVASRWGIARVIARPFDGPSGAYRRTEARRDFAVQPPRPTLMDVLQGAGVRTASVGKVANIYGDRGFDIALKAGNNTAIFDRTLEACGPGGAAFVFANLVDFDMLYGHRRDPAGYADALEAFDARLPELLALLDDDDLLLITADHGNDPTFPGTDHTREYVPVLAWTPRLRTSVALGDRATLADVGATAAAWLGVRIAEGTSFAAAVA
jgi:phosphopentomutase